jgi:hypothetical protein
MMISKGNMMISGEKTAPVPLGPVSKLPIYGTTYFVGNNFQICNDIRIFSLNLEASNLSK